MPSVFFLKRVVDEKALPFVLKMPRHLDASQMSKEEFDSRMERSFRDIEEGRVLSMEEVLRNSKKEQVNDFSALKLPYPLSKIFLTYLTLLHTNNVCRKQQLD